MYFSLFVGGKLSFSWSFETINSHIATPHDYCEGKKIVRRKEKRVEKIVIKTLFSHTSRGKLLDKWAYAIAVPLLPPPPSYH